MCALSIPAPEPETEALREGSVYSAGGAEEVGQIPQPTVGAGDSAYAQGRRSRLGREVQTCDLQKQSEAGRDPGAWGPLRNKSRRCYPRRILRGRVRLAAPWSRSQTKALGFPRIFTL